MSISNTADFIACSNCFGDFGLRATASRYAKTSNAACPNCGSTTGSKLSLESLEQVCVEFFQYGSSFKGRGWLASQIVVNDTERDYDLFGPDALRKDIVLLSTSFGIKCFFYGPPLWMFGKPYEDDGTQQWTREDFDYICESYTAVKLDSQSIFFRIQRNLDGNFPDERFCSPPDEYRKSFGRFDCASLPVLYAALDIETCLHESRITVKDEIYLATLRPTKAIKILDLTSSTKRDTTPFEDPDIWLTCLIFDSDSYNICQKLSQHIHELGYDGFISKSYFQQVAEREHKNISFFGRPIKDGLLTVECINRIVPQDVTYEYYLGPAISTLDSAC